MEKCENCEKCQYFGKAADAPETAEKDCMWEMIREEDTSCVPPCEKDSDQILNEES